MTKRFGACARRGFAAAAVLASGLAAAADFPVSGTLTFNGNAGVLPDGGVFGPSAYAPDSGAIASGRFTFPQATATFSSGIGPVLVTYRLGQSDTSSGQVEADGAAALTPASMRLEILAVSVGGFPLDVGTCTFEPIAVALAGTASAAGLDLADDGFVIPPVAAGSCGGFADQINAAIAGSDNRIEVHLAGDFTPPADGDLVFADGFDPAPGR